jgi:hypothetical protein
VKWRHSDKGRCGLGSGPIGLGKEQQQKKKKGRTKDQSQGIIQHGKEHVPAAPES